MEILQNELSPSILSTMINSTDEQQKNVYNTTTIPLATIEHKQSSIGDGIKTPPPSLQDPDDFVIRPFSNLPPRQSVDLQFRDIAYTVSLGILGRGKSVLLYYFFFLSLKILYCRCHSK